MNRKFTALVLAGIMTCSLCACGKKNQEEELPSIDLPEATEEINKTAQQAASLPNPMEEYKSLAKINSISGGNLVSPAVMGVTDEAYHIISGTPEIAQYSFSVNGTPYTFRFSKETGEDISGIYGDGGSTVFDGAEGETRYYESSTHKAACYFNEDGQYVLSVNDDGKLEMDTFRSIATELFQRTTREEVTPAENASVYTGQYVETIAGRGVIDVTCKENVLFFDVTWPNSASETIRTTFNGTVKNSELSYTDAESTSTIYDETGKGTEATICTDGTGKVVFNEDGTFTWFEDGNYEEGSVFKKN